MGSMLLSDPAVHKTIPILDPARAGIMSGPEFLFQPCKGRNNLESRSRGQPAHCPIHQRHRNIIIQILPIFAGDFWNKHVRIERRHRGHRQNIAIIRIQHHRCGPPNRRMPERLLRSILNPGIQSEIHIVPGFRRVDTNLGIYLSL